MQIKTEGEGLELEGIIAFKEVRKTNEPKLIVTSSIGTKIIIISTKELKVETNRSIFKYQMISIKQDLLQ